MRRKDREITDLAAIRSVMEACSCCRLGFCDEGELYIVPLNFGYVWGKGLPTLYFHGAREGRKMDLIAKCRRVGFEMDCGHRLTTGPTACAYTAAFQSIIGNGEISLISDPEEKLTALRALMRHYSGRSDWDFPQMKLERLGIFKVQVTGLSCKRHD